MKKFDPKRHLPVGWDWETLRTWLCWGHGISAMTIFSFFPRYFDARRALYDYTQRLDGTMEQVLVAGRTITPFWELMAGTPYLGMWCFLVLMAMQLWRHYSYHTRDAMPIYLMRRLPDKWELHRRCWTVPALSALAEVLLFAVLTGLCFLLWWFATPAPCRPI